MRVRKKSKKGYTSEEQSFVLIMSSLHLASFLFVFLCGNSIRLLFLGGTLFIITSLLSAYIGFSKKIVLVAPPIIPIVRGEKAIFWAWLDLFIGLVLIGTIILGIVTAY